MKFFAFCITWFGYASWKGDNSLIHSLKEVVESGEWDHVLLIDASAAGYVVSESRVSAIESLIKRIKDHQSGHPVKFWLVNPQTDGHGYSTLVSDLVCGRNRLFGSLSTFNPYFCGRNQGYDLSSTI